MSLNLQLKRDAEGNYLIDNSDDLINFADYVNGGGNTSGKTFTLTNDIDISGKWWTPVGQSGKAFNGTFDGNNHAINNLTIISCDECGFFGFIDDDASIKNLKLNNLNVTGCDMVGGLVGLNFGNISDCKVDGSIKGDIHVGGATGEHAENCNKNITVAASVIGKHGVGGIAGVCGDYGDVYFCTVTGNVSGEKYVGGIIGGNEGFGHSCTVTGSVTGKERVGTFVGFDYEGSFKTEGSRG